MESGNIDERRASALLEVIGAIISFALGFGLLAMYLLMAGQ